MESSPIQPCPEQAVMEQTGMVGIKVKSPNILPTKVLREGETTLADQSHIVIDQEAGSKAQSSKVASPKGNKGEYAQVNSIVTPAATKKTSSNQFNHEDQELVFQIMHHVEDNMKSQGTLYFPGVQVFGPRPAGLTLAKSLKSHDLEAPDVEQSNVDSSNLD
ncbi:hypothetical protein SESBI_02566 [Sesbania bispinosa]|nr:hypothetical protein SESBI_02566 [Sesbania bispinosa]